MEHLNIQLGQEKFQSLLRGPKTLRDLGGLNVGIGDAQENGLIPVVFEFGVVLPDGTQMRAQTVTSAKLVLALAAALRGRMARGREDAADTN